MKKGVFAGMLTAMLILSIGGTVFARVETVTQELIYNNIGVTLDGKRLDLRDAQGSAVEPFMFNGTNYLPVRAICEALGLNVDWNGSTNTIVLTTQKSSTSNNGKSVGINGTISNDYFDISIVSAKWTDTLETSTIPVTPTIEGHKLLCLTFSATNKTDSTKNVFPNFDAYVDGRNARQSVALGRVDDEMAFAGAVAFGMTHIGYVIWELPENWSEFQTSYIDARLGGESAQHFVIHPEDIK